MDSWYAVMELVSLRSASMAVMSEFLKCMVVGEGLRQ